MSSKVVAQIERVLRGPSFDLKAVSLYYANNEYQRQMLWIKTMREPVDMNSSHKVKTIAKVIGDSVVDGVSACLPTIQGSSLIWGPLSEACLLWEMVVDKSLQFTRSQNERVFSGLGRWLRVFHRSEFVIKNLARHVYEEELLPFWCHVKHEALTRGVELPPLREFRTINTIHGSFGLGSINYDGSLSILGWDHVGLGDPDFDVAFLLAELLELYCALTHETSNAVLLSAKSFIDAYFENEALKLAQAQSISEIAFRKTVVHLVSFGYFFNSWNKAISQLERIREKQSIFWREVGLFERA